MFGHGTLVLLMCVQVGMLGALIYKLKATERKLNSILAKAKGVWTEVSI